MSLNPIPMRVIPAIDPVLNLGRERVFAVYDGGKEISYTPFFAQNTNNSNVNVKMDPPDENTVVDPKMYVKIDYSLSFTGTGPGVADPLLTPGIWDAPRAFPITSTTSTLEVKVNGTAVTANLNEYIQPMLRTGNSLKEFDLDFATCPSQLDQYQKYSDWQTFGSARNPMALYGENPVQQTRGAYLDPTVGGVNYVTNTHTAATVNFSSIEPLLISPFYHNKSGFMCKTLNATWTFSDLKRVWSHGNAATAGVISNLTVNITGLTVYVRFVSPKDLQVIPRDISYPYHETLQMITTNNTPLVGGGSDLINMNAVNLQAVPQRLLVYIRRQDADLLSGASNFTYSDAFARIDNITINWANNQGKLSSASIYDLYHIARKNGCNLSFAQWSKFVGSVLPIDLGRDIGLDMLNAPSRLSNPQLSMTVRYTNTSTETITFSLFVIAIYEGTFSINHGSVTKNISVLNGQDILNAERMPNGLIEHTENLNMYGGGFWDSIKGALSSVNSFLKKYKPISRIGSLVPNRAVQAAAAAAKKLGYGVVEMPPYYYDEEYDGGKKKKTKKKKQK